jgi:type I protein arginine methyltransferase
MYSVTDYLQMIEDPVRTGAYVRALQSAVRPGDTVVEIGTGIGFFAVIACRAGAEQVFAIESDPAVFVAQQITEANGCGSRVACIHDASTRVEIPPADVLVSDLRGILPLHGQHIPTIVDARKRLLKPGGTQIPERDTLWAALVASPEAASPPPGPSRSLDSYDIDLRAAERLRANSVRKHRAAASDLLCAPVRWGTIDYRTVSSADVEGSATLTATRAGVAIGLSVWFDTDLYGRVGFTNRPGTESIYGQALLPFEEAVDVAAGDVVRATLAANLAGDDYVWRWSMLVEHGAYAGRRLEQHSLRGLALSPAALHRRADTYVPELDRAGEAQAWILSRMRGASSLAEIADEAAKHFPDLYASYREALSAVGELSQRYGK